MGGSARIGLDVRGGAKVVGDESAQRIGVISGIGDNMADTLQARQQRLGLWAIAALAGCRMDAEASTAAYNLVVKPPRDRPIAAASAPLCACRICMDFRDGAVDEDVLEVRRIGQAMEESFPYTGMRPASELGTHSCPLAEDLWQVVPACRIASQQQDRVHEQPVVHAAAAARPRVCGGA